MIEKENQVETVEVTLKLPRQLVEFFKALSVFTKSELSFEKWLVESIISDVKARVENWDPDLLNVDAKTLEKAYQLDEILR